MPELPDIELYVRRIAERVVGEPLERLLIFSPFVLRSLDPTPKELEGQEVVGVSRVGKRVVLELSGELYIVFHLMIAGRFQWQTPLPPLKPAMGKLLLAALRFPAGQLSLVEVSSKKRASIHLVRGRRGLEEFGRGGLSVFEASLDEFTSRLLAQNRTLKRTLTSPTLFDGIGNAYSDEILFHAGLSPVRLTSSLSEDDVERLYSACRDTLNDWRERLLEMYPKFPRPSDVTAFRPDFYAHGRYGQPCRFCGAPIQRIVYAENETNYCAKCQNEGRLLADRSLSRLLKSDWPKTIEEMVSE